MSTTNTQVRLAARPQGLPDDEIFDVTTEEVGEPGDGQVLLQTEYISLDPAMRGWMNEGRSYIPPVGIGEVMRAATVGRVVTSRNDRFAEGDHVVAMVGVQEYAVTDTKDLYTVDPDMVPLPTYLGTLGMTGMTAYFGLREIGQPRDGDTVVVSGAAGATGGAVGQIAKLQGCRVVGIAGGPEKCSYVTDELGFDACVDYKAGDLRGQLKEATPDRVDVYFDNVGGEILDTVLLRLARGARVVICGAISQYNAGADARGPGNYMQLLINRARMEGFVVFDFADRYGEASQQMAQWIQSGQLVAREDVVPGGVRAFPEALRGLFEGRNTGKMVLEVAGG